MLRRSATRRLRMLLQRRLLWLLCAQKSPLKKNAARRWLISRWRVPEPATDAAAIAVAPEPRLPAERVGRDADLVRDVLVGLPELDKLTAAQRETLEAELVAGACLTEALEASAGRINRLMLAGLMRKLDMCTR